jgi:hypothetical protein
MNLVFWGTMLQNLVASLWHSKQQCLHLEGSRTLRRSIETCRGFFQIQLSIKYIVHLLVICCKYMQNAWYAQFQDYTSIYKHILVTRYILKTWPYLKCDYYSKEEEVLLNFHRVSLLHMPLFAEWYTLNTDNIICVYKSNCTLVHAPTCFGSYDPSSQHSSAQHNTADTGTTG